LFCSLTFCCCCSFNQHMQRGARKGRRMGAKQERGESSFKSRNRRNEDADKNNNNNHHEKKPRHFVWVSGFPPSTPKDDLRTFVLSHVPKDFQLAEFTVTNNNNKALIVVSTKQEAHTLRNLDNVTMHGNKLKFQLENEDTPAPQNQRGKPSRGRGGLNNNNNNNNNRDHALIRSKAELEKYIESSYNAGTKVLDLSALRKKVHGLSVNFGSDFWVKQLIDILGKKCPDVTTINFAHNDIRRLSVFRIFSKYSMLPKNLCFDSNEICSLKELEHIKAFPLTELVLTNNPVSSKYDQLNYQREILRRFPNLEFLDLEKVERYAAAIPPVLPNYFDEPARHQIAFTFIKKYFELYDSDRSLLGEVYAPNAQFSFSLGRKVTNQGSYYLLDRNLLKKPSHWQKKLKVGNALILSEFLKFPSSQHLLDTFAIDCFMFSLGTSELLNVSFHGDFKEGPEQIRRNFDRTFLLAPAQAGSKASLEGWPAIIINDIVSLRSYSPNKSNTLAAATTTTTTTTTINQPQILPSDPPVLFVEVQQQMLSNLSNLTRLKPAFAEQCLSSNGWNFEAAVSNFNDLKVRGMIPPDAYL